MWRALLACALLLSLSGLIVGCSGVRGSTGSEAGGLAPTVATLTSVADTSIYSAAPAGNYGTLIRLYCGNYPDGKIRRALIRFDLSRIPATATVNRATLSLYLDAVYKGSDNYRVHRATQAWGELKATWANANGIASPSASATKTISPSMQGQPVTFTVTSLAQDWVKTPKGNYGLVLRGSEGATRRGLVCYSREQLTPRFRPQLTVTYTP